MKALETKIEHSKYDIFYKKFREKFFIDKCQYSNKKYRRGDKSPSIWKHKTNAKGTFDVLTIFGNSIVDPEYFYKKWLDSRKYGFTEVNDAPFCRALIYLGVAFKEYTLDHDDSIWNTNLSHALLDSFLKNINAEIKEEKIKPNVQHQNAEDVVEAFYLYLSHGKLEEAWKLLSPLFQNRHIWKGDFTRFAQGYSNTLGIKNIKAFNAIEVNPNQVDCLVYYTDEIDVYPLPELDYFRTLPIAKLDDFTIELRELEKKMNTIGAIKFTDIFIGRLFDPVAIENIWYNCGLDDKMLKSLFGLPQPAVVQRLYNVSCIVENGIWKIKNISYKPIEYRSSR
ncbi:MAG: hypothetical protein JNK00_01670 [Flavipsychrobacter sp.]|nr:hypothetical protein [Flavipsychrobacter sp.]